MVVEALGDSTGEASPVEEKSSLSFTPALEGELTLERVSLAITRGVNKNTKDKLARMH